MHKFGLIALNTLRSIAVPIFSFLTAMIGVQFLGKNNWGEFIELLLWVYLITFITAYGHKEYLLRAFSKKPSQIPSLFSTSISSRIFLCSLSIFLFLFYPIKIAVISVLLSFLIVIYQSFDSLVVYYQKFLVQLLAETLGFLVIIGTLMLYKNITLTSVIIAYCIAFTLKIIVLISILNIKNFKFKFSKSQLLACTPFFLIGLSGWLNSKIDLYLVNIFLSKEALAQYQIFIMGFILLQSCSTFIILPFIKHLYRLPKKAIQKIRKIIIVFSIPIVLIGTASLWFVFEKIIVLNLKFIHYVLGFLYSLAIYFFIIDIYILYKEKREQKVMLLNFLVAILIMILSIFLIPTYQITGALISIVIGQYLMLLIYKLHLSKKQ